MLIPGPTSGIMAMTGTKGGQNPVKFGSPAIDYATGMTGAFALSGPRLFSARRNRQGPAHRQGDCSTSR